MEVMTPLLNLDFDFNSSRNSPIYMSAPSTPKGFGGDCYFSAPSNPTRISQFYKDFEDFLIENGGDEEETGEEDICVAAVPFAWEEKPGKPKSPKVEFAFDVSEDFETSSVSAEELFDGGVIKTIEPPPPRLVLPARISQKSRSRKAKMGSFSPRMKKESKSEQSTRRTPEMERGRERTLSGISSNSRRATPRSLSPLRVSEYVWEQEQELKAKDNYHEQQSNKEEEEEEEKAPISNDCTTLTWSCSKSFTNRSFKELFLFRSASEGRAADKDPFSKYRAVENGDASVGSMSRRRGGGGGPPVSAHELHYTTNRAVSANMKKKTFLPYKQGILGRLF